MIWALVGIAVLALGLTISVGLHELGHLFPARKFGAAVPEYSIGFGPKLWSKRKGDTTYALKAIPAGGSVRILGMLPPAGEGAPTTKRNGQLTLAEEARRQSKEELEDAAAAGIKGKPFYTLSTPKKLVVMLGGPLMNLLLAFILVATIVLGFGLQEPTTRLASIATETAGEASPASVAGLQPGDTVISWGGTPAESWEQLRELIQATPAAGTEVVVERASGATETLTVVPHIDDEGARFVGITSELQRVRGTPAEVVQIVGTQFVQTGKAVIGLPVSLYNLVKAMITGEERDPEGVISIVGVGQMATQIASPDALGSQESGTGSGGLPLVDRVIMMLSLLAALNMALFVFNLIPLPPLDGGHVAAALYGGARNAVARMRGKPKPPPVDTARMMPLANGVFAALILMTLVLVFADILMPIGIT